MTNRPSGNRSKSDSASSSRPARTPARSKDAGDPKKKTSSRRPAGAAAKRPPRVSKPPEIKPATKKAASAPKPAPAKPAPPKPAPRPATKSPAAKPPARQAPAKAPIAPAARPPAPKAQPPAPRPPAPTPRSLPLKTANDPNAPSTLFPENTSRRPALGPQHAPNPPAPPAPAPPRPAQPPQGPRGDNRAGPGQRGPMPPPAQGQPNRGPGGHQSPQHRGDDRGSPRPAGPSQQSGQRPSYPPHSGGQRPGQPHQDQRGPQRQSTPPNQYGQPGQPRRDDRREQSDRAQHQPRPAPSGPPRDQQGFGGVRSGQGGPGGPGGGQRPAAPPHTGDRAREQSVAREQQGHRGSNSGPRPDAASRDSRSDERATAVVEPPQEKKSDNQKAYDEIFERGVRFDQLGLSPEVVQGLTEAGFEHPTAIQARIIPIILSGKDVLGQAKTGTGKTAAFGLPLLSKCQKGVPFNTLLLVPTRELAIQVCTDLMELGRHTGLRALPVYGGQNIATQAKLLERGPEIVVATPGRVMDMVERRHFHYNNVQMVVLDEVDRMLDIGFRDDIKRILSSCPRDRQTVFVSATLQPEIESLARSYAHDCEKIVATAGALTVAMVKQFHLTVEPWDKKQLLLHLLTHEEPALTIVFCRTKRTVDNLAEYLMRKGIEAHAMHGDMPQNKRNRVIEKLHKGALSVLIASDLASRGLDVEGITHVINYDLPEDPDLYVHRIGRTARAGRDGIAWSLVTPEQGPLLTEIEMLINAEIPKLDYPDFKPGPVPQDILEGRTQDARRAEMAKSFNRYAATNAPPAPASTPAAADPARFPGGIVPSKLPPRRMMGRVKTARSVKAALQQSFNPQPPAQPNSPGPDQAPTGG